MKNKNIHKLSILVVFVLVLFFGIAIIIFCSNQEGFTGNRIKNPDSYLLDIERMNGTMDFLVD